MAILEMVKTLTPRPPSSQGYKIRPEQRSSSSFWFGGWREQTEVLL